MKETSAKAMIYGPVKSLNRRNTYRAGTVHVGGSSLYVTDEERDTQTEVYLPHQRARLGASLILGLPDWEIEHALGAKGAAKLKESLEILAKAEETGSPR